VNRRGSFPPYKADFLTNYEVGWKTTWADNRLRFNGAVFKGDWDDFQFSFLGENGLTNISNAGNAKLEGIEVDVQWEATDALTFYGGLAVQKAELGEDFCKTLDASGEPLDEAACVANDPADFAHEGTRLPTTPEFKASLTGRYTFPISSFEAHLQAAVVHQGDAYSDLRLDDRALVGRQGSYTITDLSTGLEWGKSSVELFVHNAFDERADDFRTTQCAVIGFDGHPACGLEPYSLLKRPRTIGLRFGQRF
jgi:outer membrane receptor protein involved in Fe transport